VSDEDPSLFWLALDIVSALLDIKAASTAFKELAVAAREARAARALAAAESATAKAAATKLHEKAVKLLAHHGATPEAAAAAADQMVEDLGKAEQAAKPSAAKPAAGEPPTGKPQAPKTTAAKPAAAVAKAGQPTAEAVKYAELAVTDVIERHFKQMGVRDISDLTKSPTAPGVDRLFVLGEGEGAALLEVDAKLSIQERPVVIGEVSAFETAAKTGGKSRRSLVEAAHLAGDITDIEYRSLIEAIENRLLFGEEVHGFGAVTGISDELKAQQVGFRAGEQFAHIKEIAARQRIRRESLLIRQILVKPKADRRTTKQLIDETWKIFEEAFGPKPK
jgi:hypothetical protein